MAVPSYSELLARQGVESFEMEQTIQQHQLMDLSICLDTWEMLANSLEMKDFDIASIRRLGSMEEQKLRMFECWKQRCGSKATYEVLTRALLRIKRTDLAEKVVSMRLSLREVHTPSPKKPSHACSISPSSMVATSTIELAQIPQQETHSHKIVPTNVPQVVNKIVPTLQELEIEFMN